MPSSKNPFHSKEMYLTMVRETEKAIQILIEAQRKCEQVYLDGVETSITLLRFGEQNPSESEP